MGIATAGALGSVTSIALGNEFGSRTGLSISVLFAFAGYYIFSFVKNKFFVIINIKGEQWAINHPQLDYLRYHLTKEKQDV